MTGGKHQTVTLFEPWHEERPVIWDAINALLFIRTVARRRTGLLLRGQSTQIRCVLIELERALALLSDLAVCLWVLDQRQMVVCDCLEGLASLVDLVKVKPIEVSYDKLEKLLDFLAVPQTQDTVPCAP